MCQFCHENAAELNIHVLRHAFVCRYNKLVQVNTDLELTK